MAFESLQARWEQITPRERALVAGLAGLFVVALIALVMMRIGDRLHALEQKNEDTRLALKALERHRATASQRTTGDPVELLKGTAPKLDTYLDDIIGDLKLEGPAYPPRKENAKGEFIEVSMDVRMPKPLTIYELKDLLKSVETKDRRVVVRDLNVKRNFRDQDKLDVRMTIATYKTAAKDAAEETEQPADGEDG